MKTPESCPLCDAIADGDRLTFKCQELDGFEGFRFKCDRCGDFRAGLDWMEDGGWRRLSQDDALYLSLLARQKTGAKILAITNDSLAELMRGASPSPSGVECFEQIIEFLASLTRYPGVATKPESIRSYAARVRMPASAFKGTIELLVDEKTLRWKDGNPPSTSFELLPDGWKRAEIRRRRGPLGTKAFVAMWFSEEVKNAYEQGIKPALIAAGYQPPFRVDDAEHDSKHDDPDHRPRIDDRIIAELRRARFVVVDVTGARHSVYFEAGYAEALGLPMICCCRSDRQKEDMAFDTRQLPHILWTDPADLKQQLSDRLSRMGLVRA